MTPQEEMIKMIKSEFKNRRRTDVGLMAAYYSVRELTDDPLRAEYRKMTKDVLVEMIINQERVIQALIEPHLRRYEMGLTKNSSTTYGSTT